MDAAGSGFVIPWVHLGTAKVPGGGEELRLKRRGSEFSIMLGTNELMNSRLSGSEEALARLSMRRGLPASTRPKILIGGLGMGFTLRAALAELGADARVEVAEIVPAVIAWARGDDGRGVRQLPRRSARGHPRERCRPIDPRGRATPMTRSCSMSTMARKACRAVPMTASTTLRGWRPRSGRCGPAACSPSGRPAPTPASRGGCSRQVFQSRKSACGRAASAARGT